MSEHGKRDFCLKEGEISSLQADVKTLKKIVMGNGQEGLLVSVPKLAQNVEDLSTNIKDLRTGVSGLIKFQENIQGEKEGKSEIRKRNRWIIGILIAAVSGLGGVLIYLIKILGNIA